jgi:hypothetical protein
MVYPKGGAARAAKEGDTQNCSLKTWEQLEISTNQNWLA